MIQPFPSEEVPDDVALMKRVGRDEDTSAFAELIRRYEKKILNFFIRSGVQYDAEDLVQQTFLRVYWYRHRYRPTAKVSTFLFLLARQVWIDELRRRKRRERLVTQLATAPQLEVAPAAADEVEAADRTDVTQALAALPEAMRLVIELGVYQELPYSEIAAILKIPEGTVKSRMFHALAQLRQRLKKD